MVASFVIVITLADAMTFVDYYVDGLIDWFVFLQEFHVTADGAH